MRMLDSRWRCRRRLLCVGLGVSSMSYGLVLVHEGWVGWWDMDLGGQLGRRGGLRLSCRRLGGNPAGGELD